MVDKNRLDSRPSAPAAPRRISQGDSFLAGKDNLAAKTGNTSASAMAGLPHPVRAPLGGIGPQLQPDYPVSHSTGKSTKAGPEPASSRPGSQSIGTRSPRSGRSSRFALSPRSPALLRPLQVRRTRSDFAAGMGRGSAWINRRMLPGSLGRQRRADTQPSPIMDTILRRRSSGSRMILL